jgi:hypothetical protein
MTNDPTLSILTSASEGCQIRTFTANEVMMAKECKVGYELSNSSNAFASFRSAVSNPSVNQP